jgi:hypothetical protein
MPEAAQILGASLFIGWLSLRLGPPLLFIGDFLMNGRTIREHPRTTKEPPAPCEPGN